MNQNRGISVFQWVVLRLFCEKTWLLCIFFDALKIIFVTLGAAVIKLSENAYFSDFCKSLKISTSEI